MNKLINLTISIFLLTACGSPSDLPSNGSIEQSPEGQVYTNNKYNFQITVPNGPYSIVADSQATNIYISNDELNFPEMSITLSEGDLESLEKDDPDLTKTKEIEVNAVNGLVFYYKFTMPGLEMSETGQSDGCPVYIFENGSGQLITLKLHECIDSPIYDQVVSSLKLV